MTNMFLTVVMMVAAQGGPMNPNSERFQSRDRAIGVTAAQNTFILPPKIPDCRTQAEVDLAIQAKENGEYERCDPERFLKPRR
ncbi:MAG TPA: hypothetical protein VNR68_04445 [Sphingomicrobium sp.]|nr:hypothetical protein [Sphingomicrobium sp.]